jgi:hypothetical protein
VARRFTKTTALTLFCHFRQAERSIHQVLSCPSKWPQFVAYYDEPRQTQIAAAIATLESSGAVQVMPPRRAALAENALLSMVRCTAGLLWNRLKHSWSFSAQEASFFAATLERVLGILHRGELPHQEEFIELRLDCFHCHHLIARKLIGIPELRKADSIEHFNQSKYVRHVTLQEMGIHDP